MEELVLEIRERPILHWNCRELTQLPSNLREGKTVTEIYLKWNMLQCLPSWIGTMRSLTNLYLQYNQLQSLPEEIGDLTQLNVLNVAHNLIKNLPKGIGRLLKLTHLSVANNKLNNLPTDFRMLKSLKTLDLRANEFGQLPDCILECHALQDLLLDNNKLSSLPDNIVYLPDLVTLSVSGNNIHYLPLQPFSSNPYLCFENNASLSYLSMWLGKQISAYNNERFEEDSPWDLKGAQGCFYDLNPAECLLRRAVFVKDETSRTEVPIVLPASLKYISAGPFCQPTIPPLQELSMRIAYNIGYDHKIKLSYIDGHGQTHFAVIRTLLDPRQYQCLPQLLQQQLKTGPVTLCYNHECQKPIFTFGVLWVLSQECNTVIDLIPREFHVLSVVLFCSIACSLNYTQWEKDNSNLNQLESIRLDWFKKA